MALPTSFVVTGSNCASCFKSDVIRSGIPRIGQVHIAIVEQTTALVRFWAGGVRVVIVPYQTTIVQCDANSWADVELDLLVGYVFILVSR